MAGVGLLTNTTIPSGKVNGFNTVVSHLNNLKDLLDTLSAKLGGVGTARPTVNIPENNPGNPPGNPPKNNAYTFFGLTKNSSLNNLNRALKQKRVKYHPDKQTKKTNTNKKIAQGLYEKSEKMYDQLKAIFEARNRVAQASTATASTEQGNPPAPVVAAINNAKQATQLAIENGSVENVNNAVNAANVAAAAAQGTMVVKGNAVVNHPVNQPSSLAGRGKLAGQNNGPKSGSNAFNPPAPIKGTKNNDKGTKNNDAAHKNAMAQIPNMGANSLPASKPGINALERNRNAKLKNLTKNVKKSNLNGSSAAAKKGGRRRSRRRRHTRRH